MEILCLMGLFPKEYESNIINDSVRGIQNAANKFQWGIVTGFDEIDDVNIKIINSLYIGSYPKRYRKAKIPTFSFKHTEGADDINVGFTNLSGYKVISRYYSIKKEVDKWANDGDLKNKVVIAYAMTSPFVDILNYVKKKYPDIICCLVVPDLPEYMNAAATENKLYKIAKTIQINHFRKMLKPIDCYVFLTKYMEEWFDWDVKYTVVEGISTKTKTDLYNLYTGDKQKSIIYAGMIEDKYGVVDLVKAFMDIDAKEWSLELFGSGSALTHIKALAENDPRIHIRGVVPNSKVTEEQRKVELLINPRNDQHEFTKYSFPSKIIEYMGSGTPMIGYKLSGMPKEYFDYFYCVSPEKNGLKICMEKVINLSDEERKKMGKNALEFIANEKNAKRQCEKILELLKSVKAEKFDEKGKME